MFFGRKKDTNTISNSTAAATGTSSVSGKIRLTKASEGLDRSIIRLTKTTGVDLGHHKARVFVVMDRSGSMYELYRNGSVQEALTRFLPLALKFDDNGELEVYVFNGSCTRVPEPMTIHNYENYVENVILRNGLGPTGGTNYAPVIKQTMRDYDDGDPNPAFGFIITDGDNFDKSETDAIVRKSSKYKTFYEFIGIGNSSFPYLEKLDELNGRTVDNTAFFKVTDFSRLSDDELYDKLLEQYPQWLRAWRIN